MKTKTFALIILVILFTFEGFAVRIPTMTIETDETKNAHVKFESFAPTSFEFTIKNTEGEIIYYKQSEQPVANSSTQYNFSKLKTGEYHVSLDFGNCSLSRTVSVNSSEVKIGDISKNCKPYIQFNDGQLKVSLLNKSQKNVFLNVYKDGEFVNGTKLGKDLCMQKSINYSKLKKGNYDFVLSGKFSDYTFSLQK